MNERMSPKQAMTALRFARSLKDGARAIGTWLTTLALGLVFAVMVPGPAMAAERTSFNPGAYFGCADTSFLDPAAGTSHTLTGYIIGFGFLAAFVVVGLAGIGLIFAGNRMDRAQANVQKLKNAGIGMGVLALLGVIITIVAAFGTKFC